MRWYAGVGARDTPAEIAAAMKAAARRLAAAGYGLRSGGSGNADNAFEAGAREASGAMQIFVPWRDFDKRKDAGDIVLGDLRVAGECYRIAESHHHNWPGKPSYQKLLARNTPQVLGPDLDDPSAFILMWAKNYVLDDIGRVRDCAGGTGQTVRLAYARGIPVFHLGLPEHARRVQNFIDHDGRSVTKPIGKD